MRSKSENEQKPKENHRFLKIFSPKRGLEMQRPRRGRTPGKRTFESSLVGSSTAPAAPCGSAAGLKTPTGRCTGRPLFLDGACCFGRFTFIGTDTAEKKSGLLSFVWFCIFLEGEKATVIIMVVVVVVVVRRRCLVSGWENLFRKRNNKIGIGFVVVIVAWTM